MLGSLPSSMPPMGSMPGSMPPMDGSMPPMPPMEGPRCCSRACLASGLWDTSNGIMRPKLLTMPGSSSCSLMSRRITSTHGSKFA